MRRRVRRRSHRIYTKKINSLLVRDNPPLFKNITYSLQKLPSTAPMGNRPRIHQLTKLALEASEAEESRTPGSFGPGRPSSSPNLLDNFCYSTEIVAVEASYGRYYTASCPIEALVPFYRPARFVPLADLVGSDRSMDLTVDFQGTTIQPELSPTLQEESRKACPRPCPAPEEIDCSRCLPRCLRRCQGKVSPVDDDSKTRLIEDENNAGLEISTALHL